LEGKNYLRKKMKPRVRRDIRAEVSRKKRESNYSTDGLQSTNGGRNRGSRPAERGRKRVRGEKRKSKFQD